MSVGSKDKSNRNERTASTSLKQVLCLGVIGSGLLFISYRLIKLWYNDESLSNTQHGAQQKQRVPTNNHVDASKVSHLSGSASNIHLSTVHPRIARNLYENAENVFKDDISFQPDGHHSQLQLKKMKQYLKGKTMEQLVTQLDHEFIYYNSDESVPCLFVNGNKYYNTHVDVYDADDGPNFSLAYIYMYIACAFITLIL